MLTDEEMYSMFVSNNPDDVAAYFASQYEKDAMDELGLGTARNMYHDVNITWGQNHRERALSSVLFLLC